MSSTKRALDRFFENQMREQEKERTGRPRRKNGKPEWELTVKPCMAWLRGQGFHMNKIEAKAVWNAEAGRYLEGQTDAGVADAVGCCPDGTAAFIEFKAPGRRSDLKPHQRAWLAEKISRGCFAVCVDSLDDLINSWTGFQISRSVGNHVDFLRACLPKQRLHQPKAPSDDTPF